MENTQFNVLNCSELTLKGIQDMGFEEMTPIQAMSIPVAMTGKDIVGQAQTGTGKTAAFTIPMLELIDLNVRGVQALVLCPTRELAVQIAEEVNRIAKHYKGLHILPIFGGQDMERQIRGLKRGAHIVIGTPGRVLDHMRRKTLQLNHLKMLTLDEADEMLNMGFREDIEMVLSGVDHDIQTMLFSATMPRAILDIINKFQKDPEIVKVAHKALSAPSIEQVYLEMKEKDKVEILSRLIDMHNYKISIIFCNTKKRVDELTDMLQARGYLCDKIHGDMKQTLRLNVINKFKRSDIEILIATDVAARGLDIDNVEAVFNYDMPSHEEYYVHRIGRTGRAGREGISYTFITSRDFHLLRNIKRYTKSDIKLCPIPKISDIEAKKRELFLERVLERIEGGLDRKFIEVVEKFTEDAYSAVEVAAALLQMELEMEYQSEIDSVDNNKKYLIGKDNSRDAGKDRDRAPSKGGRQKSVPAGMARLHLNVGKEQGVKPRDIVGAIANEGRIEGRLIGNVQIHDTFTFVEIPESEASFVMSRMKKTMIKGKNVTLERANAPSNAGKRVKSSLPKEKKRAKFKRS